MSYEHAYDLEKAALERKIAAKDAEIAELRKAFKRAEADVQLLDRERDEARKCVKQLWPLVNEHTDCLRAEADAAVLDRKRRGYLAELASVQAVLDTIPKYLR